MKNGELIAKFIDIKDLKMLKMYWTNMNLKIYTHFLYKTIVIGLVFVLSVTFLSCNSNVNLVLNRSNAIQNANDTQAIQAEVNLQIDLAHFFVEYLQDLIGLKGVGGLVDTLGLQEYLDSKMYVKNTKIRSSSPSKSIDRINITYSSTDFYAHLNELNIPFEYKTIKNYQDISLHISREFIISFLNQFTAIQDYNLIDLFLPEKSVVSLEKFPAYIAWSFNEYEKESRVLDMLNKSDLRFVLQKSGKANTRMPDEGWKLLSNKDKNAKTGSTGISLQDQPTIQNDAKGETKDKIKGETKEASKSQTKTFLFVPLLYTDYQELKFLF